MDDTQIINAEKHIRNAWIAGTISAVMTLLLVILGELNEDIRFQYGLDIWALFDVALIAGLTFGIYRKNRWCALILLLYFVISKIGMAVSTGQFNGGLLALLFIYFYLRGTIAAFQLHKHNANLQDGETKQKARSVLMIVGLSLGSFLVIVFGALVFIGLISPDTEVVPGKQVNKKYLNFLRENSLIDNSEEVQYWYSDAFIDFKDGFYLLTGKKVIVYCQDWEDPAIIIPFGEIVDIEFEQDPSFLDDSRITLILRDDTSVYFPLSSENGGDIKFYEKLIRLRNSGF